MNGTKGYIVSTRLVFISDTHLSHDKNWFPNETFPAVPDGDVLIHCGDGTFRGNMIEMLAFLKWFASFPHKHKILISGNHELGMERSIETRQWAREFMAAHFITYLEDSEVVINRLKFYGSPHTPKFYDWAFMHEGERIKRIWDAIPLDTDVLITHGPPYGVLDIVERTGESVGCKFLERRIGEVMPHIHAFGHIHNGYGTVNYYNTLCINAAIVNDEYKVANKPIVVDIDENYLVSVIN